MVKKHWAHTYNYEDFVRFVSFDLADAVLNECMTYAGSHKNETYLSANTVVKVISDWMKEETLEEIKKCQDFTLLLNESTDESNRSDLYPEVKKNCKGRGDSKSFPRVTTATTRRWPYKF